MNDNDPKNMLPVHMILGANEYALIKTATPTRVGDMGQPIAEYTKFGWTIMSPGQGSLQTTLMFARTSHEDYMNMCSLDVLGLEDRPEGDQETVYEEFKEQLVQRPDGKYETSLPWKQGHDKLPSNFALAKSRFNSLMKKLEKQPDTLEAYHEIIANQLKEGIVEKAPEQPTGTEHYIPHKGVLRENAETTKLRIVYDASAKARNNAPSLNDCLEIGPPLQRNILDILLRARFKPVYLAGDIKQAFLQIVIREAERDALRFFWVDNLENKKTEIYRVTRALFGLGSSPFLLGGTLQQHFETFEEKYPVCIAELRSGTYVDDINIGACTINETERMKQEAIDIFKDGGFSLHKWHSNVPELEGDFSNSSDQTFAKESLGTRHSEVKLLGLMWDKAKDSLAVVFPQTEELPTKRVVLRTIAKIFDPLGIVSPVVLIAKIIFRELCDVIERFLGINLFQVIWKRDGKHG